MESQKIRSIKVDMFTDIMVSNSKIPNNNKTLVDLATMCVRNRNQS